MSIRDAVRIIEKNRKQKLEREKNLTLLIAAYWRSLEAETGNDLLAVAYEAASRFEETKPSPINLMGIVPYLMMIENYRSAYELFINRTEAGIGSYQEQARELGIAGANDAMNAIGVDDSEIEVHNITPLSPMVSNGVYIRDLLRNGLTATIAGITTALLTGLGLGHSPAQLVTEMKQSSAENGLAQALTTARTEFNRAHREAMAAQYERTKAVAGFRRMVEKSGACFACLMLDGEWLVRASDLTDHPNGRCVAVPFRSKDDPIPWQLGHDWFMEQAPEKQQKILGKGRYEAWKDGDIQNLRDMVYIKPNEEWGGSPAVRSLKELGLSHYRLHNLALRGVKVDLSAIASLEDYSSAVKYAKEVLEIPYVDFTGLDIRTAKELLKVTEYFKRNYPEVLRDIRFLGEAHRRNEILMNKLKEYSMSRGMAEENAIKYAKNIMKDISINPNSIASFLPVGANKVVNSYTGITVNKDLGGDFDKLWQIITTNVDSNYFPKGLRSVGSVFAHEYGHAFEDLMKLSQKRSIINYRSRLKSVSRSVGEHAMINIHEFIADCVMEAYDSAHPRKAASDIWGFIDEYYRNSFGK